MSKIEDIFDSLEQRATDKVDLQFTLPFEEAIEVIKFVNKLKHPEQ